MLRPAPHGRLTPSALIANNVKEPENNLAHITVVGIFDSLDQAKSAAESLKTKGFTDLRLAAPVAPAKKEEESEITTLFRNEGIPGCTTTCYLEALRQGSAVLSVHTTEAKAGEAADLLDELGADDVEERASKWGWKSDDAAALARELSAGLSDRARLSGMQTGRKRGSRVFVW